jgi:alkylation response protein AidB-like acyl-CoA dehydrogenase
MKYLVPLAKGEVIGAFCLSEPEAGSDATSQKTTAIDKGSLFVKYQKLITNEVLHQPI